MKLLLALFALPLVVLAAELKPSAPLKVFEGPEGEVVAMLEVSDQKEMLVQFKNIAGELNDQTKLYKVNDMGNDKKDIYFQKKRGSKMDTYNVLVQRGGSWTFYNPGRGEIRLTYSKEETKKMNKEELLKSYKP